MPVQDENLSVVIHNQMQLIKRLPELHITSMMKYQKKCEGYFHKTFEYCEKLMEQTRFLEYLESCIDQKELQLRRKDEEHEGEIISLQKNSKEGLSIIQKKLEYFKRNDASKN